MRITWVTRSFLDYRIPVYKALSEIEGVDFILISSNEHHVTPQRCIENIKKDLGNKVIFLSGERRIGKPYTPGDRSNSVFRIFWQPGLINEIMKTKPDIVITDAFNHWTLPVLVLKLVGARFKHVLNYERTKHTERNAPYFKLKFISLVKKYIDAVHCNGVQCQDFLFSLGYPKEKLKLGNMAADSARLINYISELTEDDKLAIRNKYKVNRIMYLFVGRLIPLKGLKELLISWHTTNLNDATLVIVGDGEQRTELEYLVCNLSIYNVIFVGGVNHEDIARYYYAADCFIIPTLEDNWSLVVPEAMSCGLPVISSIYNGCFPELVKPENGWIFDPLNEKSISDVLEESYNNSEKMKVMGQHSLSIVGEFTPQKIADQIMETCKRI